jgi:hypothetical protein
MRMRRLALSTMVAAATVVLFVVGPAAAAPLPPPVSGNLPHVAQAPENLLPAVAPYQGAGTQALDGSITSTGTFFNFPLLGEGDYEYSLGPPDPEPSPGGGKLRSGPFLLTSPTGSISGSVLCNTAVHGCLWQALTGTGAAADVLYPTQWFSSGQMKFIFRGGGFTESGFFHGYKFLLPIRG